MRHGNTVTLASERVMGVKLPALVDQVVIVGAVVTNEVAVLVRGVVDARRTVLETFVDIIQLSQGVFLAIFPPLLRVTLIGRRIWYHGRMRYRFRVART